MNVSFWRQRASERSAIRRVWPGRGAAGPPDPREGLVVGRGGHPSLRGPADRAAVGRAAGADAVDGAERVVPGLGLQAGVEPVVPEAGPRAAPLALQRAHGGYILGQVVDRLRRLHRVAESKGRPRGGPVARAPLVEIVDVNAEIAAGEEI